jgi:hypothetical protein
MSRVPSTAQVCGARPFERCYRQVEFVGPVAAQHPGRPVSMIAPLLRQARRQAFDTTLPEPCLSRAVAAIHDRTPWSRAPPRNDDARGLTPLHHRPPTIEDKNGVGAP